MAQGKPEVPMDVLNVMLRGESWAGARNGESWFLLENGRSGLECEIWALGIIGMLIL